VELTLLQILKHMEIRMNEKACIIIELVWASI